MNINMKNKKTNNFIDNCSISFCGFLKKENK